MLKFWVSVTQGCCKSKAARVIVAFRLVASFGAAEVSNPRRVEIYRCTVQIAVSCHDFVTNDALLGC